ncbi:heavy metal sensor histidine kinase [Chitinimonas lacunae]|uniref:Sensor protein n=1 Tax=Chitinimonas lacunae TaxID=1963018 RepID=A0ABV8MW80_9NEIS
MKPRSARSSLALRLVLSFWAGSALIMAGVGYTLYHALGMQLDGQNLAEINGKTEVVRHQLAGVAVPQRLIDHIGQFREITVGHPHLSIGVRSGPVWLLRPLPELAQAIRSRPPLPALQIVPLQGREARWWVRRIPHTWHGPVAAEIDVYVAVDVTDSQRILHNHRLIAVLVGLLGTLLSGLRAYFVAWRGLAPLQELATKAERLTADRLGAPLDVEHAPGEVRGLVESLNRMLARLHDSFRSLEQFSADIAHELRTPLNNLLLQTQVTLSRPREVEVYREALLSNMEELERMQRMVSDMLFLARADRGMLTLDQQPVDLRAESDSVVEFFELGASEKAQTLTVAGQLAVPGDRLMLRRALTNLLSNAVRYAPAGAEIEVRLGHDSQGPFLSVSNPGAAIRAEELHQLFARFTRGDNARSRDTDGVGLGLALVDSIMRLHQGTVEVESDGDRITFRLRFAATVRTDQ